MFIQKFARQSFLFTAKKTIWAGHQIIIATKHIVDHKGRMDFLGKISEHCLCCAVENKELKVLSIPQSLKMINEDEKEIILSYYHDFKRKFDESLKNSTKVVSLSLDDFNI